MNKETFLIIVEKLKGLSYVFFGGFAVQIYSNEKRKAKDLDIFMPKADLKEFAKRIGSKVKRRKVVKENGSVINDYGFEKIFLDQPIEGVTIIPGNKKEENHLNRSLKYKLKKRYLNEEIYLTPIEELIAGKFALHRDKDIADLEVLKNIHLKTDLVKKFAQDWRVPPNNILDFLKKKGFQLK